MASYYRAGALVTDTATNIIALNAAAITAQVCTFRANNGATAGYVVTSAKTFYITKIKVFGSTYAAAEEATAIGYADNDVGWNTTTARTNPKNVIGQPEGTTAAAVYGMMAYGTPAGGTAPAQMGGFEVEGVMGSIPAGKYIYMKSINSGGTRSVMLWGFEL